MNIHILSPEGGIKEVCNKLEIDEKSIRKINRIERGEPARGEELLALVPTRSYRVSYGDTLEKIGIRFGLTKRDLMLGNPWLASEEPRVGDRIALRYGERLHGMKAANGYYHEGCDDKKLSLVLPFLTYVTFASAVADHRGIRRIINDRDALKVVTDAGKIPLVRIHDSYGERFAHDQDIEGFAEELTRFASDGGYRGIVLNSSTFSHSAKEYLAFIMKMRKLMIGLDLILITEIDENSPIEFSEFADGSVLYYPKYAMEDPPTFAEGERKVISDFACRGESAKAFIDLPCLAKAPRGYCTVDEVLEMARRRGLAVSKNKGTLLSHVNDKKQGEYSFESLEGLKAIFDLIQEFDYMGVCFDIMRVPTSYLMMYNAMFKTCYQTNVRSREGCSRADGDTRQAQS